MTPVDTPEPSTGDGGLDSEQQELEAISLAGENQEQALRQRVLELEEKVAQLEQVIEQRSEPGSLNIRELRKQIKPILLLLVILFLAIVPSILVFKDRWLEAPFIGLPLEDAWRRSSFLSQTALPAYFVLIFASLFLLLILALIWKDRPFLIVRSKFPSERADRIDILSSKYLRYSNALFIGAGVIYILTFISGRSSQLFVGWGYSLAILSYALGWFVREASLDDITRFWARNWELVVSFFIFHIALILFMLDLALKLDTYWIFAVLLLLSIANLGRYFRRIPIILWIVNAALVLFLLNINRWTFSVIGDDYGFYMKALEIARTQNLSQIISSLFDANGVYGSHPYFSSLLQAISMKLLGTGSFGWRFSSLYLSAVSILFFYLFYKSFIPRGAALLSAVFLAASSYIMSFGKVGYNNLQALFAMSVVLAAAAWAIKTKKLLAFVVLGLGLGFCLYVYPAALYVTPLPVLLLLFYDPPLSRRAVFRWLAMVGSFGLLLWPLLFQPNFWTSKLPGLFINNPEIVGNHQVIEHLVSNLLTSFFSFLFISAETHFVAAAYMDPLSAVLVFLGLVYFIKRMRQERFFAFFLLGLLVLLLLVGASHDRRFPPTTRMFLLLPWFALLAAVGLQWFVENVASLGVIRISKVSLYAAVVFAMLGLNLYQAYPLSQRRSTGNQTVEMLFVRMMERLLDFEPQTAIPKTVLFVTEQDWGIDGFYWLLRAYEYPVSKVQLARMVVDGPELPRYANESISERNTLVIIQPDLDFEWQEAIGAQIESLGKQACEIREANNRDTRFVLWYSPGLESLCFPGP
ncbi:MAG: glycosyltransferase family 39 protein [Anaerolineales bacterium]|nr:glycosyltransferase family 39 protein [Anaerolineales bacterium]